MLLLGHGWTTLPDGHRIRGLAPYFGNASLGVLAFFVISGYLITHLLRKEWEKSQTIDLRLYYARRVLRIFPAFYNFLLAVLLLRAGDWIATTYADITIAGAFLTNYKHCFSTPTNDDYWYVGHFWTLALEEQFYLLWPVTVLRLGLARAPRVAMIIVLAAPILRVITYFTWPSARGQLGMMLHTAADPLMVGCLTALWQGDRSLERVLSYFSSWCWPLLAAAFLLVVDPWLQVQFRGVYAMTIGRSLSSVSVAFVLLWVICTPASILTRLLSTPLLCHVGVLSYSLYLWQQLFLTTKNTSILGTFPFNFLACFGAAELSYWVIERPFLRLRGRLRRRDHTSPDKRVDGMPLLRGTNNLIH